MDELRLLIKGKERDTYSIHYSCNGFYSGDAVAPVICCIAMVNLKSNEKHIFEKVNDLCYFACLENLQESDYSKDYVRVYMEDMKIEEYGGVPHLPIESIDKIDECRFHENIFAKSFNFFVIDELAKKRLLKQNPKNKDLPF